MKRTHLPIVLTLAVFIAAGFVGHATAQTTQPEATSLEARVAALRQMVEKTVDALDEAAKHPESRFEARQLTQYAHYTLVLGQPPAKAEMALKRALACQDMNPKSDHYGEFVPAEGADYPVPPPGADPAVMQNAVTEVTVLPMVQVLIRYGDSLSPELRDQIKLSLRAAVNVIRRHQWSMDLANIYLQSATDILLIGEVLKDQKLISESSSRFTTYSTIARQRGIEEYISPNFSAVQLYALLAAQTYTLQPDVRTIIDPMVKFQWMQIAANVVPNRGTLGGPHSREVDFPFGTGSIDTYLYLEGFRDSLPSLGAFNEGMRAYVNYVERGWRPDDDVRKVAVGTRVVINRWGLLPGRDRYVYINDVYAMGCASASASPSDRSISFEFASPNALPAVWVVPDFFDAPYGHVNDRNGQPMRPGHFVPAIAAVQEKSTLLALLNLRTDVKGMGFPTVATNIVFPSRVDELRIDGKPVDCSKPFEMDIKPDSMMLLRVGPSVLIARLFDVDGVDSQKPVFKVKFDGNPWDVARLVAYHFKLPPNGPKQRIPDQPIRPGVLFIAGEVHNDAELQAFWHRGFLAKPQSTLTGNAWQVKVVDGNVTLEAGLDVQTDAILARKVNGADYQPAAFTINGVDWAGKLLGY